MRGLGLLLLALALAPACGGEPPRAERGSGSGGSGGDEVDAPVRARRPTRDLAGDASYRDLVGAIRALDDAGEDESGADCLIAALPSGSFRLEGDLGVAVRPPPDPPASLLGFQEDAARGATIFSRWGVIGPPPAEGSARGVVLVALTMGARTENAEVLWVGEGEIRRQPLRGELRGSVGPFRWDALHFLRAAIAEGGTEQVYIAAAAGLSLRRLSELAGGLPSGVGAVLTVPLPGDTRVPTSEAPAPGPRGGGLCAEPFTGGDGELDVAALRRALAEFVGEDAPRCIAQAGPQTRWGGEFRVRFRVASNGAVDAACAAVDELASQALRGCILQGLQRVRLPEGAVSGGSVVLELPLRLAPRALSQRLRCE